MSTWSTFWAALNNPNRCRYCTSADTYRKDGEGFDGDGLSDEHVYDGKIEDEDVRVMLFEPEEDKVIMEIWIGPHLIEIPVNYCPICGRRLTVREEEEDGADK